MSHITLHLRVIYHYFSGVAEDLACLVELVDFYCAFIAVTDPWNYLVRYKELIHSWLVQV